MEKIIQKIRPRPKKSARIPNNPTAFSGIRFRRKRKIYGSTPTRITICLILTQAVCRMNENPRGQTRLENIL